MSNIMTADELELIIDNMTEILAPGYGDFEEWHESEINNLIEIHGIDTMRRAFIQMYTENGIDDLLTGEIGWVKENLGLKFSVSY